MPVTMFSPLRAPIASPVRVSRATPIARVDILLTLAHLPEIDVQHSVDQQARLGLDHDGRKHGRVDQHATLQEQVQGPLCTVVLVPPNRPRLRLDLDQRFEGLPQRRFLPVPALADPRRVDVLCHVVCVRVRHEPRNERRGHGGQDKAAGACQGGARNAGEGRIVVAGARLADGPDRVDVAGDEEEDGDGAAAADGEAEEGQLEQVRRRLGVVGRRVQPRHQRGAQMAAHDHERGNAAQALGNRVSRAIGLRVQRDCNYVHLSSWRRGEAL